MAFTVHGNVALIAEEIIDLFVVKLDLNSLLGDI